MESGSEQEKPSVEDVKRPLQSLLDEKSLFPQSVLLKGSWGVGKTSLWRRDVVKEGSPSKAPIYVSLFGVSSISSVKMGIITGDDELAGTPEHAEPPRGRFQRLLKYFSRNNRLAELADSTLGNFGISLSAALLADMAFQSIKDRVVCFDDVERKSPSLDMAELLGLVETLRDTKSCRVLCIANLDGLDDDDRATLAKYNERVFDQTVTLDPPPEYAMRFVQGVSIDGKSVDATVQRYLQTLDLGNIRVANKAIRLFDQFTSVFTECEPPILRQVLQSLILISAAEHIGPEKYPDIQHLSSFDVFADVEEDQRLAAWQRMLRDYDWGAPDNIDNELFYFVQNGVIRSDRMRVAIQHVSNNIGEYETEAAHQRSWRRFHDSFEDDGEEVVTEILETTRAHIKGLSANNLDATVRLLRDVGRDADADDLIQLYVSKSAGQSEKLDLDRSAFGGNVRDEGVRKSLSDALAISEDGATVQFIVEKSLERGSIDPRDLRKLSTLSEEEWSGLIVGVDGKDVQKLLSMVDSIQYRDSDERAGKVYESVRSALTALVASSPIRKLRLEKWGLSHLLR